LPSRALARGGCGAPGVGLQAGEDGVADLAFERAALLSGFCLRPVSCRSTRPLVCR